MKRDKPDHRSPLARERDAWLESADGRYVAREAIGEYDVKPFLAVAFEDGFKAAERILGKEAKE